MRPLQKQQGSSFRSRRSRRRLARKKRGVSDVVATIILLALTVTLFASIFAFVTTFPSPPAQSSNQFQAKLIVTANGTYVSGIQITHLAGPNVPTSAQIYLKSAVHPGACPFTSSYPVSWDSTNITGSVWTLGETWSAPFSSLCMSGAGQNLDQLPDNITVYVVNNANLLFHVILPGTQIVTPPQIVSAWAVPSPVAVHATFSVEATITGSITPGSVYVNLANVPGLPTTPQPMQPYQGLWIWNSTGNTSTGPTKAGSYSGFINVSGPKGAAVFGTVPIPVTASSGGMVVSISGNATSGVVPLGVVFGATISGANGSIVTWSWSFGDGTFSTVQNPPEHMYTVVGSYLVSLTVQDAAGNDASATLLITVDPPVQAISFASGTSYSNCFGFGSTTCPNLYWQAWDNATYGVSVSGTFYANGTHQYSYPISSTPIGAHSTTGVINPLTGAFQPTNHPGTYTITVLLKVIKQSNSAYVETLSYTWPQTITITG